MALQHLQKNFKKEAYATPEKRVRLWAIWPFVMAYAQAIAAGAAMDFAQKDMKAWRLCVLHQLLEG
jgi:hypothetical protein